MEVGFTGTREGMTRLQASKLQYVLALFRQADQMVKRVSVFHYGTHAEVELLADAEAARIAAELGYRLEPHRALRGGELVRNQRIVAVVHALVAAPLKDREEQRSGTWATVRYARERGIPTVMLPRGGGK